VFGGVWRCLEVFGRYYLTTCVEPSTLFDAQMANNDHFGMSFWRIVKWFSGVLFLLPTTFTGKLFEWFFAKDVSNRQQGTLTLLRNHWPSAFVFVFACLFSCGALWLIADINDRLQQLARVVPLFIRRRKLEPRHFQLVNFRQAYLYHPEYYEAERKLREQRRLLILGHSAGGKTRMAFNLARGINCGWVLRLKEDFGDWQNLDIPSYQFLYRPRILWFVDDLDKYVGKSDLSRGLDLLSAQCRLHLIVTCRSGKEWESVNMDRPILSLLEGLPRATCAEFTSKELVRLAQLIEEPSYPALYDGTPGSVVLALGSKRELLTGAPRAAQLLMRGLYLLRRVRIYSPRTELAQAVVGEIYSAQFNEGELSAGADWLAHAGFIRPPKDGFLAPAHDAYLSRIVVGFYDENPALLKTDVEKLEPIMQQVGTAEDLFALGLHWGTEGSYDRAITAFNKALAIKPNYPEALLYLGVAFGGSGQPDKAIVAYKSALSLKPDFPEAAYNLGSSLLGKNQLYEAEDAFNTALAFRPDFPEALNNLGVVLLKEGKFDDAAAAFNKALSLKPALVEALLSLSVVFLAQNQLDEAIDASNRALALKPNYPEALTNLAIALIDKDQLDQAIGNLHKALALKPDLPQAAAQLGVVLYKKGQLDEAIIALNRALALKPDLPSAVKYLELARRNKSRLG
jgi:tetratricopeptide (TPR) repeat protein